MKKELLLAPFALLLIIIAAIATRANNSRLSGVNILIKTAGNACVAILTSGTHATSRLTSSTGAGTSSLSISVAGTSATIYADAGCNTALRYKN